MARSTRTKTPEEEKTLAATEAALERGEDPLGDNDPPGVESIEQAAERAEAEAKPPEETPEEAEAAAANDPDTLEEQPKPEEAPPPAKPEPEPEPEPAVEAIDDDAALEPQPYRGKPLSELDAEINGLEEREAAEFKKLMAGEIDDDAYTKTKREVDRAVRGITVAMAKAQSHDDQVLAYQRNVVTLISREAAKNGMLYSPSVPANATDEVKSAAGKASKQFDVALSVLANDPDNAGRSFKSLAREANATVLAMRGISAARAKPADPTKPVARPQAGKPPMSLRAVPVAATPAAGGSSLSEQGKMLKGAAYEAWFARLSSSDRARLTDD